MFRPRRVTPFMLATASFLRGTGAERAAGRLDVLLISMPVSRDGIRPRDDVVHRIITVSTAFFGVSSSWTR